MTNLPASTRSLRDENVGRSIPSQEDSRIAYVPGHANRNEALMRFSSQMGDTIPEPKTFHSKQTICDDLASSSYNEPWHIASKYERDENEDASQNALSYSARSFLSESGEIVMSVRNERLNSDILDAYDKFKQAKVQFEDDYNERGELESYRAVMMRHDDDKNSCSFNRLMEQTDIEISFPESSDVYDAKWNQRTSTCRRIKSSELNPDSSERAKAAVAEDTLSSETPEPFGSEDHSRSSYVTKMCLQMDMFSNERLQSNVADVIAADKYDQEVATVTNVPTLVLNSQDVSYSTSTGSRECPAAQPLDPHALIKALSDVSLKRERQESASRKRDDLARLDNDAVSSDLPDFSAKGETWRVAATRNTLPESEAKRSLTRVTSKIPVKISSSKNISFTNVNNLPECHKNVDASGKPANDKKSTQFVGQAGAQGEASKSINRQQSATTGSGPYSDVCRQCFSQRTRDVSIEVVSIRAQSNDGFPSDNEPASDYKAGALISPHTPYGNEGIYDKTACSSNKSRFDGNVPPLSSNEGSYSSSRDYAKIDDDVRSKSDRSTSRKSVETMNITSATESPYPSRHKQDSIPRNVEENATWRTEDECASINNEEDTKGELEDRDYDSCGDKAEETYLHARTKEHAEPRIEELYSWSKKQDLPQIDLSLEIERIARRQANKIANFANQELNLYQNLEPPKVTEPGENPTCQVKAQEISGFVAKMSSPTLNPTSQEPKKKRKSQERFPFTISEASRTIVKEHMDMRQQSDYQQSLDKNYTEADDPLKEKAMRQLKAHPSITRLASAGLENTVAEILCCVAQEQRENESSSRSRMKAFVRIFASKLRKGSKQRSDRRNSEPAKIIYENRACQVTSKTNSCSSADSSTEKSHNLNLGESSNNHWIDQSNSVFLFDGNVLNKSDSLEAIAQEHPRKYERDNLWVQDVKETLLGEKETRMTQEDEDEASKRDAKDRYSIFLAKDFQSDKLSRSRDTRKGDDMSAASNPISTDEIARKTASDHNFVELEELDEDDLTGCLCLRLCRLFTQSADRFPIRQETPAKMRKSSSLLWKRKK